MYLPIHRAAYKVSALQHTYKRKVKEELYMSSMLIVIDMQNDFVDGALGTKEAQEIAPRVIEKIKNYKGQVLYNNKYPPGKIISRHLKEKSLPAPHCIRGTKGWQPIPEIGEMAKKAGSLIFDKPTFGSMALAGCLNGIHKVAKIDGLEIVGLCTDICVVSNALLLKATMPDVKITVDASCCAGVTPQKHEAALETMRSCQIEII